MTIQSIEYVPNPYVAAMRFGVTFADGKGYGVAIVAEGTGYDVVTGDDRIFRFLPIVDKPYCILSHQSDERDCQ